MDEAIRYPIRTITMTVSGRALHITEPTCRASAACSRERLRAAGVATIGDEVLIEGAGTSSTTSRPSARRLAPLASYVI